jgi:hypothetical protein
MVDLWNHLLREQLFPAAYIIILKAETLDVAGVPAKNSI